MAAGSARAEGGFTLLETLIAFVIAGAALGVLYQGAAGGVQATRVAVHSAAALSRARSRLAVFDDGSRLVPGEQSGDDGGGYAWRATVARVASAPYAGTLADEARAAPLAVLYAVRVTVSWRMDGGERQVSLSTARLGAAGPGTVGPAAP